MLGIKINKRHKYLLACTYGSDSMCLLDMLLKESIKPIVCFVNYHKYGNSDEDLEKLTQFCKDKDIVLESFDTHSLNEKEPGNAGEFSQWARDVRYKFFKEIYDKYDANGLFIAHNQDDLIESYLLKSQTHFDYNKVQNVYGMILYKPLINLTKEDTLNYDLENHVPFSKDTMSFEEQYTKHPVRFDVINKLSEIDRENIINEIKGHSADKIEFLEGLKKKINSGDELDVREIIALSKNGFAETVAEFIGSVDPDIKINDKLLQNIRKMCLDSQENMSLQLSDTLWISKEYDVLTIGGNLSTPLYSYTLAKPGKLKTDYFELDFSNGAADRGFRLSDYPLTIRPAVPEDLFNDHGFMTPVRKVYYDWRMPPKKKVIWPVLVNKYGEVIYIPRYHRLHRTDHTSKFEIKFDEDN